jgi:hypothetical protein
MRVLAFSSPAVFLVFASACANGGNGAGPTPSGDDGGATGDATTKSDAPHPAEGGEAGGDGPASAVSAAQACADNAAAFCTQLEMCAPYLLALEYGDKPTCESRQQPGCLDALAAPGTGWTGDNLEACVKARTALDCNDFLHAKPQPTACFITGTFFTQSCLYDAQCGTGYCKVPGGATCGNCVALAMTTGQSCMTTADCGGNLLCAGNSTCQPPSPATGPCSATMPCVQGTACIGGTCVAPGGAGATCSSKNNGADCDSTYQGVYCDATTSMCTAYTVAQPGDACGAATTVCGGGGVCFHSLCSSPVADGSPCNAASGLDCMAPSSCLGADGGMTCALFSATNCK